MLRHFLVFLLVFIPAYTFSQARGVEAQVRPANDKTIRALIIGISKYQSNDITQLKYAHVDALAISDFLKNGLNVPTANVQTLLNDKATTGNVIMALYSLSKSSEPGDRVIVYFSGHGDVETLTSRQSGFLLTYDTNPQVYIASALGVDVLNQFVSDMTDKGAKVMVISDACRSGNLAGGPEGIQQASSVLANRVKNEIRLLACQSHEISVEGQQWGGGRGLFSFELINGWRAQADLQGNKDGVVTLLELQRYLTARVPEQAAPSSQNPLIFGNVSEILGVVSNSTEITQPDRESLLAKVNTKSGRAAMDSISIYRLENLIGQGRLIGEGSAFEYYQSAITTVSDQTTRDNLKRVICSAFLTQANTFLNQYLNSKSFVTSVQEVTDNIAYLTRASELLADFPYYTKYFQSKLKFYQALLFVSKNDNASAEKFLLESVALEPNAAYAFNELGIVQQNLGKNTEAARSFQKALALSPKWIYAHINMSNLYLSQDKLKQAIEHYRILINQGFEHQLIYENLAAAYDMVDSTQEAEIYYQKAVNTGNLSQELLNNISTHYMDGLQYKTAVPYLISSIELNRTSELAGKAYVMKAVCHYYLAEYNDGVEAIRMARTHSLENVDKVVLYKYAALTALELNDKPGAEAFLKEYFALGGDLKVHRDVAAHYITHENYQAATKALSLVPPNLRDDEFYFISALCLINQYDYQGTLRELTKVKNNDGPKRAEIELLAGKSYLMLKDYPSALSALQRSVAAGPKSEAYYWLSLIHILQKNNDAALDALSASARLGGLSKAMIDEQELFKVLRYDERFIKLYKMLK